MTTDRIERNVLIQAPRGRVWRALSDSQEFGAWFGIALNGAFTPGAMVTGRILAPEFAHLTVEFQIERIEPEDYLSYRWHPFAIDPEIDYSQEPTTLVEFRLADEGDGTRLTVTESGFDAIPLSRRETAFRMNDGGWAEQLNNIRDYVAARV